MTRHLRTLLLTSIAVLIFGLSVSGPALADSHQIKFRKSIMKSIGGTMGGLVAVLKKQVSAEYAAPLASNMAVLSKIASGIFPEDSDFGETRALPAIWENPGEFKKAIENFQMAAANLSKVSASGDMSGFGNAFKTLGKACGACHKKYREKKN